MGGINHSGVKWGRVGALATRQHGVVSRKQLRALGIGDGAIERALASGRLLASFRGTFGVGHLPNQEHARTMAAVLACGRGSVVSHLTAARLLGLWDRPASAVDVIAPGDVGREIAGIRRHYVPLPHGRETGHFDAIPCTSPSRTIVDLAGTLGERALRGAVESAAVQKTLEVAEVERILARRRRRGAPLLRRILSDWRRADVGAPADSGVPDLRSALEARLLALISANNLPVPRCNASLVLDGERLVVDFLWPERRLVVETDGRRFHDNPLAFERDRARDRALQLGGYRVVRFTHTQVEHEAGAVAAAIRRLLASRIGLSG